MTDDLVSVPHMVDDVQESIDFYPVELFQPADRG